MYRFQGIERWRRLAADVVGLPAHQVTRPRRFGQRRTATARHRRRPYALGQRLEGQRQERIANQNGHAFAEHLVARGPAATQIVVVHSRKIVMHQRVGVDHFHRAGCGHGGLDCPSTCLRRQEG